MSAYLNYFYQKLINASRIDQIGLYRIFSFSDDIKQEIETRTRNHFNKLWENPDFRLYLFYRIKNNQNIANSMDWLTTMVANIMGIRGLKQPDFFKSESGTLAYFKHNQMSSQTVNLSDVSLKSDIAEMINTLFHELTHELQDEPGYYADDTWGKIIRFNKANYISPQLDRNAYFRQPIEAEAYFVGTIVQQLVQEKCTLLAKQKTIAYPEYDAKDSIYGFSINPYQYWNAAYTVLQQEKRTKKDCEVQFRTVLGYLDKAIDYGRFVNNGSCARDAIGFLGNIVKNEKFQKFIPDMQDKIKEVLNKYKDDPLVKQQITKTMMQLGTRKVQLMYSALENTPGQIAINMPLIPERNTDNR